MKNIWIILLLIAIQVQAQWSDDPSINNVINSSAGAKYVPKVAVTPSGNYFFSWYGGSSNLDMNLAYFDHSGVEVWPMGAMKVSTYPQNSWVDDYTLISDNEGNAVVVFSDIRNGNKDVVVYKIDSLGNQLFGEDGIVFSVNSSDEYQPNVIATENNDIIVLASTNYSSGANNEIHAYKIEADGTLSWGEEGKTFSGFDSYSLPQGIPNEDNGFNICFYKESGSFPALTRHIAMMRCDEDGNQMWTATATDAGGISAWDDLTFKSDGNNGAWFVWSDDRYSDMTSESYVQWINGDGTAMWETNGILLSQETGFFQFNPAASGVNNSNELVVFWNKVNSNQSMAALMAQRVSEDGNLLEGSNGKTILDLNAQLQHGLLATPFGDSTYYCYNFLKEGSTYLNDVYFIGLDKSLNMLWGDPIAITNSNSDKSHAVMAPWHSNQAVVCWSDELMGSNRVVAQNVFTDGQLGTSPVDIEEIEYAKNHHFIAYTPLSKTLQMNDLEANDIIAIHNLYGQRIVMEEAQSKHSINHRMKGIYIASLIRNGKSIEEFKFLVQ